MPVRRLDVALNDFTPEEMTWCRSRITALRIMLPALDPVLHSLIRAMANERRADGAYPDELTLPLEKASVGELELAADLLGRLAGAARDEEQPGPAKLLDALVGEVRDALA